MPPDSDDVAAERRPGEAVLRLTAEVRWLRLQVASRPLSKPRAF